MTVKEALRIESEIWNSKCPSEQDAYALAMNGESLQMLDKDAELDSQFSFWYSQLAKKYDIATDEAFSL